MTTGKTKKIDHAQILESLADKLAAAWNAGSWEGETFESVFDKVMDTPYADQACEVAVLITDDEEQDLFRQEIYNKAGRLTFMTPLEGGTTPAQLCIFTLLAQGDASDIASITSAATQKDIVKQFLESGYAHRQSNVVIANVAFNPLSAISIVPSELRALARQMAVAITEKNGEMASVYELLNTFHGQCEDPFPTQPVTRLLIGCRLIAGADNFDYFSESILGKNEHNDEEAILTHESAKEAVNGTLISSINDALREKNLNALVYGPYEWCEGLSEMAFEHIFATANGQAVSQGVSLERVDEFHIACEEEHIYLAFKTSGVLIGPISVPAALYGFAADEFAAWAIANSKTYNEHGSCQAFISAIGAIRH